jgi:Zn-dependent protease
MFGSTGRWRIGSLLGFPVEISWSFLLLLIVLATMFGPLAAVVGAFVLFGSVLLHELGHAVVARSLGVRVSSIELGFFGGAAKMVELPRSANHEILIAAAGPAVSLMLAGVGFGLGAVLGSPLVTQIGWVNAVIAAFNLLPALPMDGGRILRALLTRRMDYVRATDVAVKVARVFSVAFGVIGLVSGPMQLLLLAPMLWMMGTQERWLARALADEYVRTREGYAKRSYDDPVVLPRGAWDPRGRRGPVPSPFAPRPFSTGGARVWLRRTSGGRWVIDVD